MPTRRQIVGPQGATFTANTTATFQVGGILPGTGRVRVQGVYIICNAVPADADGTMLLNVLVTDATEGASDSIVTSQDLETLVVAANTLYPCTLTQETAEKELTLEEKDTIRISLVSNSAAIDTNATVTVIIDLLYLDE